MTSQQVMSITRQVSVFGFAAVLAASLAGAQSTVSHNDSNSPGVSSNESSSLQLAALTDADGFGALPAAPVAGGAGGGQYRGERQRFYSLSHIAIEGGGGFNAPIGNDTPYITWGGNLTGGVGLNFSQRLAVLGEFQFMDNKLPGAFVAAGGGQTGNSHIVSLTVDPVFDLINREFPRLCQGGSSSLTFAGVHPRDSER